MMKKEITVYATKYALTKGISKVTGSVAETCETMFVTNGRYAQYFHGTDWHLDEASAIAKAELMRKNKIASMEKQIKKLKEINFKVKE